jgi:hypothetical protein
MSARIATDGRGRFRFTPAYLAEQGGPIVELRPERDTSYEVQAGAWLNRWPWGRSFDYARESHWWAMIVIALEANPASQGER